jgi:hypothetical protein
MKKKVRIEKVPKRKVRIESLPKAVGGIKIDLPTAPQIGGGMGEELTLGGNDSGTNMWQTFQEQNAGSIYPQAMAPKELEWKVGDSEKSRFSTDPIEEQKMNPLSFLALGRPILNLTKGGIDEYSKRLVNKKVGAQQAKNQAIAMAETNSPPPYETQGYDFTGRNALAADGMQIRQIGGMGEPNVEVEGREHIKLPNGFSQEIQGKSHAQGGIPLNLPQGTQIFSEKLKIEVKFLKELAELNPEYAFLAKIKLPEKGSISYADLAKKFETKKYVDLLNSKTADPIQKTTAQMMMSQSLMALEKIFMLQEQNKLSGVHGPQVQQNAMEEMEKSQAQEQQEQPMEEQEEPMMAHGGYHLPIYRDAGKTRKFKIKDREVEAKYFTPGKVPAGYSPVPGYKDLYMKETETRTPGKTGVAAVAPIKDPYKGPKMSNKEWLKFLATPKGQAYKQKYITGTPAIAAEPPIITKAEDYVYTEPEIKNVPVQEEEVQQNELMPINLNVAASLPMSITRDALNFYKLSPQYIDPRYLDIQPQLNAISRAQRAVQSNIGSRGTADISNLLQAQQNAAAAQQQAFGQKYNYDRAQDAAAQQFNAQAKMDIDQYNQGSWFQQLEDPIRRREGAIDTWQRAKAEQQQDYRQKMTQYYNNLDFMKRNLPYFQNMTPKQAYQYAELMGEASQPFLGRTKRTNEDEENLDPSLLQFGRKYGGKVKIKPKIKGKLKK